MSVTKRAWKLQEFVAHSNQVNCLALGHKSGRVMVTGGEDKKINMWAIGKPNCIMSLSGHTSPVEAVRFGSGEEMVVAGSLSGALKIWDLEAAKIVRTLTGHKASIRSLDFHPYGDYVASGSLDANIKLWDIRRKGCIFTYKGHTNCINSLRFSPDGRWIASGGEDSKLKIWDLTAGKMLTDLDLHTGPITTIEFHPNEFLLASGSADRTVKFWDLETFQLVNSTDGDCSAVRCIFFHPDGLCLYSGANNQMKVYGWEPSRCYDSLVLEWGMVSDIAMAQNQLIGASFSQTNVATYVVDIQRVAPCGTSPTSPPGQPQVLSPPVSGRKSFCLERPPTQCTNRPESVLKEAPEDVSTASEETDDDNSPADIKDPEDYREIFQPKYRLPRDSEYKVPTANYIIREPQRPPEVLSPAKGRMMEPFPAPLDEAPVMPVIKSVAPVKPPVSKPAPQPTPVYQQPPPPPQPRPLEPVLAPPQARVPAPPADDGLNMEDFMPKKNTPALSGMDIPKDMSETEAVSSIMKGHDSMAAVMNSRSKNLQIVRALWTAGNTKTAVDSAIGMNDQAVIVDLLNVLMQRPALWNLDLCAMLLPIVKELLASKYEKYVQASCGGLKVILRNFGTVIKSNISAPPSIGVDISREERFHKCKSCYSTLMDIRSMLDGKNTGLHAKMGNKLREIQLLLSSLD